MERDTCATNPMLPNEATSDSGPVRTMTYGAYRSGIIYIRPGSRVVVMVPNISGNNYFPNGSATTLLADGTRIFHVSVIPRSSFSYWIPSGMLTNTLAPVVHFSSSSGWNWTYPVINHTPRFAGVNHGPGRMPLHPSHFHTGFLAIQDRVRNVDAGLSREVISARMRCIKYQPTERSTSDNDTCCICLEDFTDGQNIGSADCEHSFHFDCISHWLMQKNSCPLCKRIALAN